MPEKEMSLPFLTREMFKFEQGARFSLTVQSASVRATTITISGATRSGTFRYKHTCVSSEVPQLERFNLPDIPIWISAISDVTDIYPGEVYVQLSLSINNDIMQPLTGGYVYGFRSITWPSNNVEPPLPEEWGRPMQRNVANPAAGANFTYSTGVYTYSKIQAVTFTLTTSATVANRRAHVAFFDSGLGNMDFFASVDQAASTVRNYTFAAVGGAGSYADDNDILVPIPANLLCDGQASIASSILNLQAGDQLSLIRICTNEKRSTMFY